MKKILFLHGALSSKHQFDPILPQFSDEFEVDAISFSGHGGMMFPVAGYSFEVFANDILNYLNEKKIEKINLFGFSMGGYAALFFTHLHPERVEKIFTLNVKFKWELPDAQKEVALLNAENILLKVPSFANNLMMIHGLEMWKNVLKSTEDMMMNLTKGIMLHDEDLKKMSFPVLLAVGDKDLTSGLDQTVDVYKKIPRAQLCVLPDTSHPFETADPAILIPVIKRFFKS
ncbi:MAG: alpha/beta fold hydrolase [Bacteroidia bacterium]